MKIGDYVRTKDGYISKIICIEEKFMDDNETFYAIENQEWRGAYNGKYYGFTSRNNLILKSSPDIRDLIEYGDIIKYKIDDEEFISEVWGEKNNYFVQNFDVPIDLKNLNIKSIVTKEQFESMEYEVK